MIGYRKVRQTQLDGRHSCATWKRRIYKPQIPLRPSATFMTQNQPSVWSRSESACNSAPAGPYSLRVSILFPLHSERQFVEPRAIFFGFCRTCANTRAIPPSARLHNPETVGKQWKQERNPTHPQNLDLPLHLTHPHRCIHIPSLTVTTSPHWLCSPSLTFPNSPRPKFEGGVGPFLALFL
ncbi:hypothetical protein B0H16DRAFT_1561521 [Mycena metata]|uniref:Uncharacterized protein n=1 Tax=Mycena metata TaxID=1033252 RepID=A0AAD7IJN7_9AGAR|nr:hypothetical protein B0H16DRAFT_1561521 [Mycena metata]